MEKTIGVGLIGASVDRGQGTNAHLPWARVAHVPAIRALEQFHLVAVGTTKPETAEAAKDFYSASYGFSDSRELIEHPEVDLVVVSVRVPHHYDLVRTALDAGKHVYCEWPLALTAAQARDLARRAEASRVCHIVGLQAQAAPAFGYVKDLIDDGYVGQVLSVNLSFSVPTWGGEVEDPVSYLHDASNNATLLSIYGGHALDAICHVFGELRDVSALIARRYLTTRIIETGEEREKTAPDQVVMQGTLESGCVLSAHLQGGVRNLRGVEITIRGTEGDLRMTTPGIIEVSPMQIFGARSSVSTGTSVEATAVNELRPMPVPVDYRHVPDDLGDGPALNVGELYLRLARGILDGEPCSPGFDVAARRQEMLEAMVISAETGRRQNLTI